MKNAPAWSPTENRSRKLKAVSGVHPRTSSSASLSIWATDRCSAACRWWRSWPGSGLGADGLSSSCYGPSEAFGHLGSHASYLALFLGLSIAATVFIISACYSHIIEEFPSGGGGYLVASKLLGNRVGVVSGCALLVDYVLTITVSIAAAGDAVFSLLGEGLAAWKLPCEYCAIVALVVLNLRGIKESVQILRPVFVLFLVTHAILILGSITVFTWVRPAKFSTMSRPGCRENAANPKIGILGILGIFLYAYSMGSGTYTGLEAVSNSMPVMREPRVRDRQADDAAPHMALVAGLHGRAD